MKILSVVSGLCSLCGGCWSSGIGDFPLSAAENLLPDRLSHLLAFAEVIHDLLTLCSVLCVLCMGTVNDAKHMSHALALCICFLQPYTEPSCPSKCCFAIMQNCHQPCRVPKYCPEVQGDHEVLNELTQEELFDLLSFLGKQMLLARYAC